MKELRNALQGRASNSAQEHVLNDGPQLWGGLLFDRNR